LANHFQTAPHFQTEPHSQAETGPQQPHYRESGHPVKMLGDKAN
jgi:hypothetical protein